MNNQFRVEGSGFRVNNRGKSGVKSQGSRVKGQDYIKSQIPNLKQNRFWSLIGHWCLGFGALLLAALLLMVGAGVAQAKVVSSTELIEHPKKYDGKVVTFRGEAVGDVMIRGNYAWINVNDDSYRPPKVVKKQKLAGYNRGQSIWIKKEEAQKITHLGTYKHAGDIVKVVGTFNRACQEHGGDMDIHGKELKIVKRGYLVKHPLQWPKRIAAIGLFLLALVLFQANRIFQKKQT